MRTWGRLVSVGFAAAMVVACGGSSVQFLGLPDDDGGADGSASDGSSDGASSDGTTSNDGGGPGNDGGKKDGGGGTDAPAGGQCGNGGTFAPPSAECTTNDSCVYGLHEVSCCGPEQALAFNHSFYAQFQTAEAAWDATCPKCGCPSTNQVTAQDGKTGEVGNLQVKCVIPAGAVVGTCTSYFP